MIVTTPNIHSFWYRLRLLFGLEIEVAPIEDKVMGYGHVHIWSNSNLIKVLEHNGFKNIRTIFQNGMYFWDYKKFPKNPFNAHFYIKLFSYYFYLNKKVGWTQIVVGEKQ